jgi:hypothetical protein
VRPIYRRGDRVLVELSPRIYLLLIQSWEIIGGELWLYAMVEGVNMPFPATRILRRLSPGESFTLAMLR